MALSAVPTWPPKRYSVTREDMSSTPAETFFSTKQAGPASRTTTTALLPFLRLVILSRVRQPKRPASATYQLVSRSHSGPLMPEQRPSDLACERQYGMQLSP